MYAAYNLSDETSRRPVKETERTGIDLSVCLPGRISINPTATPLCCREKRLQIGALAIYSNRIVAYVHRRAKKHVQSPFSSPSAEKVQPIATQHA